MKKVPISIAICCFLIFPLWSQNFIGMTKEQLKVEVKKNNSSFNLDDNSKNSAYNYLKFVDTYNEETWIFMLDSNDVCTRHKLMSDYSNLNTRVSEFDKKYKKAMKDNWVYIDNTGTYKVDIKRDEYYFIVSTVKIK